MENVAGQRQQMQSLRHNFRFGNTYWFRTFFSHKVTKGSYDIGNKMKIAKKLKQFYKLEKLFSLPRTWVYQIRTPTHTFTDYVRE
jgi:hypothetical protein